LDQVGDRFRVESKFLSRHRRDQLGARFEPGIVKLLPRMILAEMLRVFGLQERALVMVEPPGKLRRGRIFEVNDGVLVAVEHAILERLRSLVRHSGVEEFGIRIDALPVKPREDRGGGSSVEALVMKADANPQLNLPPRRLSCGLWR